MKKDLYNAFGYDEELLFQHFLEYGLEEGRNMSPVLDIVKYRESYEDLENAFGEDFEAVVEHYVTYGVEEGRTEGIVAATPTVTTGTPASSGESTSNSGTYTITDTAKNGNIFVSCFVNNLLTETYIYDASNNLLSLSTYEYDTQNRLVKVTTYRPDGTIAKIQYNDENGYMDKIENYNEAGVLTSIEDWDDMDDAISLITITYYNADGSVKEIITYN